MGCNKGTEVESLRQLLVKTLEDNGLALGSVTRLVSHEVKAGELGLVKLANQLGVEYRTESAEALAAHDVPTPSDVVAREVGTPSVSEAAVLCQGPSCWYIRPKPRTLPAPSAASRHMAICRWLGSDRAPVIC
ncbi:hypothetical protein JCM18916A_17390 [Cutibacterium acnes subsp. acnes]